MVYKTEERPSAGDYKCTECGYELTLNNSNDPLYLHGLNVTI
ncbi:hypothetical protein ALNOE001_21880 [Candidatus Methanobinarius endosymbioticus]|uniref:Uncharacterized protein n=1 Tax=Candidatus Methanobinarius endosymbioticus TaxID=2006182 RepID=A0A366M9M7_9EURY|nr:hypothetical protein ALNOE001_21880 [Candidatus Methanobinarius endosymbioticus]